MTRHATPTKTVLVRGLIPETLRGIKASTLPQVGEYARIELLGSGYCPGYGKIVAVDAANGTYDVCTRELIPAESEKE